MIRLREVKSHHWLQVVIGLMLFGLYISPLLDYKHNIAGKVPGDPYAHAGQLEWYCRAFVTGDYVNTDYFAPVGVDMSTSFDMPLLNLLVCHLRMFGPVLMFNLIAMIQVGFILGWTYMFARTRIDNFYLRWSLVLAYGFSTYYLVRSTHHIPLLSTIWAIPAIWWAIEWVNVKSIVRSAIAGVIIGVVMVSAWQNIPNLALLGLGLIWTKIGRNRSRGLGRLIGHISIAMLAGLLVMLPFIWPPMLNYKSVGINGEEKAWRMFNADLLSYIIPWREHVIFPWFKGWYQGIVDSERNAYYEQFVGFDLITLALGGWCLWRRWKEKMKLPSHATFVLTMALIYILLSLGPYITAGGIYLFELPYYQWFARILPFSLTRTPARYGIVAVFLVTGLIYQALDGYLKQTKQYKHEWMPGLIMVMVMLWTMLLSGNIRYPVTTYSRDWPLNGLAAIADDPDKTGVWYIPVDIQSDPTQNLLQAYHRKPVSSAYVSYTVMNNQLKQSLYQDSLVTFLDCDREGEKPVSMGLVRSGVGIREILNDMTDRNIRYVIVNKYNLNFPRCASLKQWVDLNLPNTQQLELLDRTRVYDVYRLK